MLSRRQRRVRHRALRRHPRERGRRPRAVPQLREQGVRHAHRRARRREGRRSSTARIEVKSYLQQYAPRSYAPRRGRSTRAGLPSGTPFPAHSRSIARPLTLGCVAMKLELRDITKRFGTLVANDRIDADGRAGRDPLPPRRERRRQVDADERPLRPLPGRRGRDRSSTTRCSTSPARATRWPPASAWCTSTSCSSPSSPSPRTSCSATRRPASPAPLDLARRARAGRARSPSGSASTSTPTRSSRTCPVGVQQRVEIIKALSRDAQVLVFDEPTAVLTPQETDELMEHHAPAQGGREGHRLHHPQAARGARGRRPDHRHPARQGRRRGLPDGEQRRARRRSWSAARSS